MILQKNHTDYERGRIPGILCTAAGSLLAYYECRKTPGDWAQIDLKLQKSTDGESWRQVLKISGNGQTLNNPVMLEKDGRLHFLYCENYRRIFRIFSDDEGESWSEPVELTDAVAEVPHTVVALGPGHGILTPAGAMVVPMWFALEPSDLKAHKPSFIASLYSLDGESWQVGEVLHIEGLLNPSECAMALLTDGWVIMSIRNENDCRQRCFAVSPTGYSDWDGFQFDERFPDPVCQGSMAGTPRLLCHLNCDSTQRRENLTLKVSRDGFASFQSIPVAQKGGYGDLCIKDGRACILYETETEAGMDLCFTTVEL